MKTINDTLTSVGEWAQQTFGTPTPMRAALRANTEMAEMLVAVNTNLPVDKQMEEAADVVIVLAQFARSHGKNLWDAVENKMRTNRARTWKVAADGTGQHVA